MSTPAATGIYVATIGLLGIAGVAKAVRPADTATALRVAGLPVPGWAVRAGAVCELGVAVAALVSGSRVPAALVAVSYLAFSAFVAGALVMRWPLATCGCLGRPDTKPTVTHLVVDLAAAGAAASWAIEVPGTLPHVFAHQPWAGIPLGLASGACCFLGYLLLTNPLAQARH
jgi:hypothetical protein